ncbi:MAG: hypothetical protein COB23_07125 [Methylophaga sp.]|nr:MAG: hypothetical protein COB23_07125 [Methylophaga sp.]
MNYVEEKRTKSYPLLVKLLLVLTAIAAIIALIGVYVYYDHFGRDNFWNFGNQESFGLFGDYIGGLLNPILTFLTVALLVWSIQIQIKELQKSTSALEETKIAHQEQLALNIKESERKQLHDSSNMHIKNCEDLLNKPIFELFVNHRNHMLSIYDMIHDPKYQGKSPINDLLYTFPTILEQGNDSNARHLYSIKNQLAFSISTVCSLITYLKLNALRHSWDSRVQTLMVECKEINILSEEEFNDFKLALLGANEMAKPT